MMRQYELVDRVRSYHPGVDEDLLNKAYVYSMQAHGNQKRASGDPFFSHPLEVAAILADLKLDDATIAAALLHDTIEDTEATREEIESLFGEEIASLVDGLTKIAKLDLVTKRAEQAENFRKLLVAISSDIRVLLVKLADRLHNLRTLEHVRPATRKRTAEETLDIYAPLAGRMGMQGLREELEDLAFRWLHPEAYSTLVKRLKRLQKSNRSLIGDIEKALRDKLQEAGIEAEVLGREKRPYSIWRKMERKQISLEQLSDIYGFRVITRDTADCYRVLGEVHTTWRAVPGRFKDYISNPKQNDYRSIHTTIVGPRHQRVELQIRSREMHQLAEYGVAAHALYKDASYGNGSGNGVLRSQESRAYQWLRHLVEMLLEGDNPEEFLEHTKLELFHDQVFCFTPKGSLIALPSGATPIDFAYAVHTDVGNSCVGCKVNGRPMPLITELKNGDEVEILRGEGRTPPPAWEGIAVTGKARSAIRRATREAVRKQYCKLGREILGRAFQRAGKSYRKATVERALARLSHNSVDDVLAAVGRGELSSSDVVRAAYPDLSPAAAPKRRAVRRISRSEEGWFGIRKAIGLKFRWPGSSGREKPGTKLNGIPIRGQKGDLPVRFAAKGGAVPGDRIVGILTPGEGIAIYPIHAEELKEFEDQPERWIDVTWDIDENSPDRFPAQISVTAINEPGTLAQIAQVISEADGNIDNVKMTRTSEDYTEMLIDLEVWDLTHLNEIISGIRGRDVVSSVSRVQG
ncbi:MAG: bifunctional (p)ppGpp synthetase/guanosine-3',5'-bis(diphosphate) 3'-pyrophosphohydrolase [Alphaproteobacteria bacterium]|nr:MAG: bifunctional (p)ppGpp synthetase/guanosine-3',5'-bis(diphosphate) 3'-pyrophosphohydrolase [Alphaproteobacteria bacterium]